MRVGVLTKAELQQATTRWAQGGVAAVLGGDPDSTDLHLADTLAAGAGLCDGDAVRVLVDEGPARVHELIALGAAFDREVLLRGEDHTLECGRTELKEASHLRYSSEPADLRQAQVFIVTVPTPVDQANRPDMTPLYPVRVAK